MRNPFRSEAEAFSFVLVCVALFAAVAVAGILAGGWAALAVFVVLAVGVAFYVKGEPKAPAEAVASRAGDGRRRILVVANETVAGRSLRDSESTFQTCCSPAACLRSTSPPVQSRDRAKGWY